MELSPRKIGFILTGVVAGIAGVYFFSAWRKGSAPANDVFGESEDGEETY